LTVIRFCRKRKLYLPSSELRPEPERGPYNKKPAATILDMAGGLGVEARTDSQGIEPSKP